MRYDKAPLTQENIDHRNLIRSVYGIGYGQTELFHILSDAGMFRVISPDELDARNRAIMKAEELGMLDEHIIKEFITKFFEYDFKRYETVTENTDENDTKRFYPENI